MYVCSHGNRYHSLLYRHHGRHHDDCRLSSLAMLASPSSASAGVVHVATAAIASSVNKNKYLTSTLLSLFQFNRNWSNIPLHQIQGTQKRWPHTLSAFRLEGISSKSIISTYLANSYSSSHLYAYIESLKVPLLLTLEIPSTTCKIVLNVLHMMVCYHWLCDHKSWVLRRCT